jgi:hypothetical protein
MIALVLAGIGGVAFNMFRDGGWFGSLFDRFWNALLDHPLVVIPVAIAVFVIGKFWHDYNVAKGHTSKLPNFFLYGVMAAGAFFVFRLATTGSF